MPSMRHLLKGYFRRRRAPRATGYRRHCIPQLESLERRELLAGDLVISEIMASNRSTLFDANGLAPDWIEIHNAGTAPVGLAGWTLTDDPGILDKWELPERTLDADEYLIVFASGTDRETEAGELHANFQLDVEGDYVALVAPEGVVVAEFGSGGTTFPQQYPDVSYGVVPALEPADSDAIGFFLKPTPGEPNDTRFAVTGPIIRDVTENPGALDDDEDLVVTATVAAANGPVGSVSLVYRVMFGREVTVPMADDGTGSDAAAGDGVFTGVISHLVSDPGEMLRWSVSAIDVAGYGSRAPLMASNVQFRSGLFTFQQDFAEGNADGLSPELGTWTVTDGRYGVTPGAAGDTITLVPALDNLIDVFAIEATINAPTGGGFSRNGGILFDYHGPTDFKFAMADSDGGQLTMGHRDASGWHVVEQRSLPITPDTDHDLRVTVDGSRAALLWRDVKRLEYDFQTLLHDGLVGFGSEGGAFQIDDIRIEPTVGLALEVPEYYGTIIADRTIDSNLPVLHWFVADTYLAATQPGTQASMFFLDEFYDNIHVDQHGQSTNSFPKKSFDVSFNPGIKFKFAEGEDRVSDFNLLTNYADKTKVRNTLAYEVFRDAGHTHHLAFPVRVQRNGRFYSVQDWVEEADTEYLERLGLDPNGATYKVNNPLTSIIEGVEKRTRKHEDRADLQELINSQYLPVEERNAWFLNNLDISSWVNFLAAMAVEDNHDCCHKNYFVYRDSDGTGLWQILPWDVDLSFGHKWNGDETYFDDDLLFTNSMFHGNAVMTLMYGIPGFQAMYLRRLRTLMDQLLQPPGTPASELKLEARIDELIAQIGDDAALDQAVWGFHTAMAPQSPREAAEDLKDYYLPNRREYLYNTYNQSAPAEQQIPAAQVADPEIVIAEIESQPASGDPDEQYIRLDNSNPFAVDISGWRLAGDVGHTFRSGTVIPAGGSLFVVADLRAFLGRSEGPGGGQQLHTQGEFSGRLPAVGGHVELIPFDPNPSPAKSHLRITELNFNPHDPLVAFGELDVDSDQFEFVELVNTGTEPINLEGVAFTEGFSFTFGAIELAGGERILVVADQDAFESRYGVGHVIAGEFAAGKLSNSGEQIRLEDSRGEVIVDFAYDDGVDWPGRADGKGATLEVVDAESDLSDPGNWRSSPWFGGTPGTDVSSPETDVVINEVLSRDEGGNPDRIELHNTTSSPIDVSGWYLSDDSDDLLQFAIAGGTTIAANGYLVLAETEFGFGLSGTLGDDVWLVAADRDGRPRRFADHIDFGPSATGVSLGRWPDGDPAGLVLPMTGPSFGSANSGPATGDVIIAEVHYNPPSLPGSSQDFSAGADDFTEVTGTWRVTEGRYHVTPGEEEDSIAVLEGLDILANRLQISATVRIPALTDLKQNAVLMFDYHSPSEFKFVSAHVSGNKWRIGQRDASGWHFLAETATAVEGDTDYRATIDIRGSEVSLWIGIGSGSSRFRILYDFGVPLAGGHVALGTRGGEARFDDIVVEQRDDEQEFEFIEIVNTTQESVDLAGWRLEGAVTMTFPAGTTLGPEEVRVVVGFDPAEGAKAETFHEVLDIDNAIGLLGPYIGFLSNGGEVVQLTKPAVPGSENAGYVLVDQVRYDDGTPWPLHADGFGGSLNRAAVDAFGNVASSWSALAPTPGIVRYAQPGDLNFDGDTDVDDIHRFALVLADPSAYRTAYGVPATMVGDVDGDGDVDFDDIDDFVVLLVGGVPAAAPQAATGPGVVVPPRVLAALPDAEVIDAPATTAPRTILARRSVPALSARQQEHRRIGSRRGERVGKRLEEKLSGALGTAKDQLSSLADS